MRKKVLLGIGAWVFIVSAVIIAGLYASLDKPLQSR